MALRALALVLALGTLVIGITTVLLTGRTDPEVRQVVVRVEMGLFAVPMGAVVWHLMTSRPSGEGEPQGPRHG